MSAVRGHPARRCYPSLPLPVLCCKIDHFIQTPLSRSGRRLFDLLFEMGVELGGPVARHAQALPLARLEMLREINDLADVISVVRDLPIDGLNHGVILAADPDCAHQVFRLERLDGIKDAFPTLIPVSDHLVFRRPGEHHKFDIAIALRFLAVSGKKIGPAREHVAGQVLHVDGDAVGFFIDVTEKVVIADLLKRAFREFLVVTKGLQRVGEIVFG